MPVVIDARTGKPEYFCDECGQDAPWEISGKWYCREHKDTAGPAAATVTQTGPTTAVSRPAETRVSGVTARRDGQLDLF